VGAPTCGKRKRKGQQFPKSEVVSRGNGGGGQISKRKNEKKEKRKRFRDNIKRDARERGAPFRRNATG